MQRDDCEKLLNENLGLKSKGVSNEEIKRILNIPNRNMLNYNQQIREYFLLSDVPLAMKVSSVAQYIYQPRSQLGDGYGFCYNNNRMWLIW